MKIQFLILIFIASLLTALAPKSLAQNLSKIRTTDRQNNNLTLVISDVDDTIKQSNVQSRISALLRARDDKSRFLGMSELYQWIARTQANTKFYYVSNAPARWMEKVHQSFLANGNFPPGSYHPRRNWDASVHKINTISRILQNQKPTQVIFFGDNTQKDATVYSFLTKKFAKAGIQFHTFIRVVYPAGRRAYNFESDSIETTDPIQNNQFAFVTPVEVSLELYRRQMLPADVPKWFADSIVPFILKEKQGQARGILAFPNYVDCRGFRWPFSNLDFVHQTTLSKTLSSESIALFNLLQKRVTWRCSRAADSIED